MSCTVSKTLTFAKINVTSSKVIIVLEHLLVEQWEAAKKVIFFYSLAIKMGEGVKGPAIKEKRTCVPATYVYIKYPQTSF